MATGWTGVRGVQLGLVLWLGAGTGCNDEWNDEDFNEQVIVCEEAFAHIESCCGSLDGRARCSYVAPEIVESEPQGVYAGVSPSISPRESRCYRALSCARIQERGDCEAFRGTAPFMEACE